MYKSKQEVTYAIAGFTKQSKREFAALYQDKYEETGLVSFDSVTKLSKYSFYCSDVATNLNFLTNIKNFAKSPILDAINQGRGFIPPLKVARNWLVTTFSIGEVLWTIRDGEFYDGKAGGFYFVSEDQGYIVQPLTSFLTDVLQPPTEKEA